MFVRVMWLLERLAAGVHDKSESERECDGAMYRSRLPSFYYF